MSQAVLALFKQSCGSMAAVVQLMNAQSGNKYLLRAALSQNSYWKELHRQLVSADSVQRHLAPELEHAKAALEQSIKQEQLADIVAQAEITGKKLAYWRNKTPPGTTRAVETTLIEGLELLLRRMKEQKCSPEVAEQVPVVAAIAQKAIVTERMRQHGINNDTYDKLALEAAQVHIGLLSSWKVESFGKALEEFRLAVAEATTDSEGHHERMASFGTLQQALQAAEKKKEEIPPSLREKVTDCFSAGLASLSELLRCACVKNTPDSEEGAGQLLAEATLLQAVLQHLVHSDSAVAAAITQLMEASRLISELQEGLTPVTVATSRIALQLSTSLKALQAMDLGANTHPALTGFCTENFKVVLNRGTELMVEAKSTMEEAGAASLGAATTALESIVQKTEWKKGLSEESQWKDVVSAARPVLLNEDLCHELVQAFAQLKKDRCTQ